MKLSDNRWALALGLLVAACWGVCARADVAAADEPAAAAETTTEEASSDETAVDEPASEPAESPEEPAAEESTEADSAEPAGEPEATEPEPEADAVADEAPATEAHSDDAHSDDAHEGADHGGDHGHHDLGHGDASPGLEDPSVLAKDLAVYTFVVFLGLLMLLLKFAWPTISEALEAREKRIEQNIADAETQLEKAQSIVAEHEKKLAGAADQVRELLAEAHRDAEATRAKAKADAKAETEAERQRAVRDIEQARDAAVRSLAEQTAGLAIDLAGRVVKQEITPDRQSEIVREALGRFSTSAN